MNQLHHSLTERFECLLYELAVEQCLIIRALCFHRLTNNSQYVMPGTGRLLQQEAARSFLLSSRSACWNKLCLAGELQNTQQSWKSASNNKLAGRHLCAAVNKPIGVIIDYSWKILSPKLCFYHPGIGSISQLVGHSVCRSNLLNS